ncbi:MAG: PEP-CTERM sorting domain-containing protein [Fimbriimonadaceae bacterium]|nr:PEP-CTERM sorting domain-containing protein [Fimbriimonadaceae bacterium]
MIWRASAPVRLAPFVAAILCAAGAQAQVVAGQIDTFQDGTTMNWSGGASPTNIPDGGPLGAGDRFLRLTATGGGGSGSRIATFNDNQWSGDFQAAGVTRVEADLLNMGNTTLEMRIVLFRFNAPTSRFTSANAVVLAPGSGWQHVAFDLDSASLVSVAGSATYAQTITDVGRMMFRHDPGGPSAQGTSVVGQLGIDNVQAVPEPATLAALALGMAALGRRRRSSEKSRILREIG